MSEATSHEKTIYMAQSSKGNCGCKNGSNKTGYLTKKTKSCSEFVLQISSRTLTLRERNLCTFLRMAKQ